MVDGLLAKLTITPFDDPETIQAGPPSGPPFVALLNPESFTLNHEFEFESENPAQGDDGKEAKFKSVKPRSFSFEFLLDGTGASGPKVDVSLQIELFKQTVSFSGRIHRPPFLIVNWGSFLVTCVLENFSITYKLFRPSGTPLRATIAASFREHKPNALKELLKNLSSPDITHAHLVKASEHLTLVTHQVYQDPRYYFQVGEANQLNNLRQINPGQTLYLPPLRS